MRELSIECSNLGGVQLAKLVYRVSIICINPVYLIRCCGFLVSIVTYAELNVTAHKISRSQCWQANTIPVECLHNLIITQGRCYFFKLTAHTVQARVSCNLSSIIGIVKPCLFFGIVHFCKQCSYYKLWVAFIGRC